MIVIPTLELRGGICVPAGTLGPAGEPSGSSHPVAVVRAWANAGFRRLQVVDLDGDGGRDSNADVLEDIIRDGALDVQAAGDVNSIDQIERFADAGANRVVLDGRAIEEPRWLASVSDSFPGLLVVSTDVRARKIVTRGWVRSLPLDIFDVVEDLDGLPLGGLLVSAYGHDGPRSPMDLSLLEDIAESCEFPVMATGGVTSVGDIRALEHRGVAAVLLGAALLSGELDARGIAQEYGG
jgi:phosphoribosylformimino-5-aminoimidazole carboxamide ribotide isomerase